MDPLIILDYYKIPFDVSFHDDLTLSVTNLFVKKA